jgi:hypothetical protein
MPLKRPGYRLLEARLVGAHTRAGESIVTRAWVGVDVAGPRNQLEAELGPVIRVTPQFLLSHPPRPPTAEMQASRPPPLRFLPLRR